MKSIKYLCNGPGLVILFIILFTLWNSTLLLLGNFSEDSVKQILTLTIRTAFIFFLFAFSASSIRYFIRSDITLWLIKNRRYIGLCFASSFIMHFIAIGFRAWLYPDPFIEGINLPKVISGGALFGTVLLLALTSSDSAVRNVRPTLWRFAHLYGSYYIFYRFFESYLHIIQFGKIYYIAIVLMLIVLCFRTAKFITIKYSKHKKHNLRHAIIET